MVMKFIHWIISWALPSVKETDRFAGKLAGRTVKPGTTAPRRLGGPNGATVSTSGRPRVIPSSCNVISKISGKGRLQFP